MPPRPVTTETPERDEWVLPDAQLQGGLQRPLDIEIVQVAPGAYAGELSRVALPDLEMYRDYNNLVVYKRGATPRGTCIVSLFARGVTGRCQARHYDLATSPVFLTPADTEFDALVGDDTDFRFVAVAETAVFERAALLDPSFEPSRAHEVALLTQDGRRLAAALEALRGPLPGELPTRAVTERLLALLAQALTAPARERRLDLPAFRYRLFCRARDHIEGRLEAGRPVTLPELCREARVSARTLQYVFREHLGVSPMQYERLRRLNAVKEALCRPEPGDSVTAVATRFAFLHLGRFAADYRKQFGERPSQTLDRARGAASGKRRS